MVRQFEVSRLVWALVMFVAMFIAISAAGIAYTRHTQVQSDQRWCDLFTTLDAPTPAPTSARGKQAQNQIHKLRVDLGCVDK